MKHLLIAGIFGIIGLGAYTHGFSTPSTYSATSADMALIQSIQPSIDRILVADAARGQQILTAIQGLSTRYSVDTREYYILWALYDYMDSNINKVSQQVVSTTPVAQTTTTTTTAPTPVQNHSQTMTQDTSNTDTLQLDTYMLYSPKMLDTAIEAGLQVVINFRAARCPTCKATSDDIIDNQDLIPEWVIILEADYDKYIDLKDKYWVTRQTTFVFLDKNGEMVKQARLTRGIDQLLEELK